MKAMERHEGASAGRPRDQWDRLVGRWLEDWGLLSRPEQDALWPVSDVTEDDTQFCIEAELPGMKREDLDVSVSGHTLILSGSRVEEHEHAGEGYRRIERRHGEFHREYPLPESADLEHVEASYRDGLLRVRVPKSEPAARKVELKD